MKAVPRIEYRLKIALLILITSFCAGIINPIFSQEKNRNSTKPDEISDSDSLNESSSSEVSKISINPFLNRSVLESKLLYWNYYNYSEPLESQLFFPEEKNEYRPSLYSLADYRSSKNEFRKSMRRMLSFQSDTDLGVFGKILGYTGFAATLGLAIIHLNKYKDFYKNDDKKK